jgi:hypothetical protein
MSIKPDIEGQTENRSSLNVEEAEISETLLSLYHATCCHVSWDQYPMFSNIFTNCSIFSLVGNLVCTHNILCDRLILSGHILL